MFEQGLQHSHLNESIVITLATAIRHTESNVTKLLEAEINFLYCHFCQLGSKRKTSVSKLASLKRPSSQGHGLNVGQSSIT